MRKSDAWRRQSSAVLSVALGAAALLAVYGIVRSPGEAFRASLSGLQIWWQTVFPGLLPPLILAELLAASGLLHGLSALAEPATRRLFRLPGAAGWAIASGWTIGVPGGAKEIARLRESGMIQDEDVDTLLLVAHLPNPFLIVVVVGGGFLLSPELGWVVAAGLWLSAVVAGALWARFAHTPRPTAPSFPMVSWRGRIGRALRVADEARREDGRPFGKQLSDAVTRAVATLMAIGGLMMIAAVALRLLQLAWPSSDVWLAVPGVYEMHLGAYQAGQSALYAAAPASAAALVAAALAWTGWSGLLQARAAFTGGGAFPWARFLAGRLLHAALALAVTFPLAKWVLQLREREAFTWMDMGGAVSSGALLPSGWTLWTETSAAFVASIAVFAFLALLASLIRPKPRIPRDGSGGGAGGEHMTEKK